MTRALDRHGEVALAGVVAMLAGLVGFASVRGTTAIAVSAVLISVMGIAIWTVGGPHLSAARADDNTLRLLAAPRLAFFGGLLLIGQLTVRPVLSLTAADYLFLAALALTVAARLLTNEARGLVPTGLAVGCSLFALGAILSALPSDASTAWIGVVARFGYLTIVWTWTASVLLRARREVSIGSALWVVSLTASGIAAMAQLLFGDVVPGTDLAFGRMTGTAQHVNDLGGSSAVALPVALGLALGGAHTRGMRLIGLVGTGAITAGLLLSGSVGGMLAGAIGVAIMAAATRRLRSLVVSLALVAAAAVATVTAQGTASPGALGERIAFVTGPGGTLADRVDVFRLAWARIVDDPLIGVGVGVDPRAAGLPDLVHSALLSTWFHGGALALAGVAVIVLTALRAGAEVVVRAQDPSERLLAASLLGAFSAYLVFGLGEPTLYVRYGWVPVALLLSLRAIQIRDLRDLVARQG